MIFETFKFWVGKITQLVQCLLQKNEHWVLDSSTHAKSSVTLEQEDLSEKDHYSLLPICGCNTNSSPKLLPLWHASSNELQFVTVNIKKPLFLKACFLSRTHLVSTMRQVSFKTFQFLCLLLRAIPFKNLFCESCNTI